MYGQQRVQLTKCVEVVVVEVQGVQAMQTA